MSARRARALGIDGHACWTFDRDQEFTDAALEFLEDGLHIDQRIGFVDAGSVAEHRERLDPLGEVGRLLVSDALQLVAQPSGWEAALIVEGEVDQFSAEALDRLERLCDLLELKL